MNTAAMAVYTGYMSAMAFTDGSEPGDGWQAGEHAIAPELMGASLADCTKLLETASALETASDWNQSRLEQFGLDFWRARNGDTVGFIDGSFWGLYCPIYKKLSREFGRVNTYLGDDKKVHSE